MAPLETQNLEILSKNHPIWAVFGAVGEFSTGDSCTTCPLRSFFRRVHVSLVPRRSDASAIEGGHELSHSYMRIPVTEDSNSS